MNHTAARFLFSKENPAFRSLVLLLELPDETLSKEVWFDIIRHEINHLARVRIV